MFFHTSVLPSCCRFFQQLCLISPRATCWEMLGGPAPRVSRQGLALAGSFQLHLSTQETREKARRTGLPVGWQDTAHRKLGAPRHLRCHPGRDRQSCFLQQHSGTGTWSKSHFFASCTSAVDWIAAVGLIFLNLPFFFFFLRGDSRFSPWIVTETMCMAHLVYMPGSFTTILERDWDFQVDF